MKMRPLFDLFHQGLRRFIHSCHCIRTFSATIPVRTHTRRYNSSLAPRTTPRVCSGKLSTEIPNGKTVQFLRGGVQMNGIYCAICKRLLLTVVLREKIQYQSVCSIPCSLQEDEYLKAKQTNKQTNKTVAVNK